MRGKPSKIKDAEGEIDGGFDGFEDCESQPLVLNSEEIRLRIMESGTRFPAWIAASASKPIKQLAVVIEETSKVSIPREVLFRTFSRSKSPELIEASSGNLESNLSVWVPFPTPGAPTRMTRAALLSCRAVRVIAPTAVLLSYSIELWLLRYKDLAALIGLECESEGARTTVSRNDSIL